jgi:hypothetical protein
MYKIERKKVLVIGGIVIAFAAGVVLGDSLLAKLNLGNLHGSFEKSYMAENSYSAVYLSTGEIYIGKLSFSPKMRLDDAYLLQTVKDQTNPSQSNIQLAPLSEGLWSPKELFLNPSQVIFYGPVKDDSKAAEALRNAGKK